MQNGVVDIEVSRVEQAESEESGICRCGHCKANDLAGREALLEVGLS